MNESTIIEFPKPETKHEPKRATRTTFKMFLAKHREKLLVSCISSFDGMTDCCEESRDRSFRPAVPAERPDDYNLGIHGVYLVGHGGDSFSTFRKDGMTGIHVYNCCGSFDVAVKDEDLAEAPKPVGFKRPSNLLPENLRMMDFLQSHGIRCVAKYRREGSTRGAWHLYNSGEKWTPELAEKLNALGFRNLWNEPLGRFNGNGGTFSVQVRGHNELLNA